VPVSSFCEPKGERPAIWHWFALKGSDARPLFAFPGIWRNYKGPLKKNGEPVELEVFAFMTTTPNELVGTINHERMPVLLTGEERFETWLQGSTTEAFGLACHADCAIRIGEGGAARGLSREMHVVCTTDGGHANVPEGPLESLSDHG
jgi:putative SOS response-associated peptidase YedK